MTVPDAAYMGRHAWGFLGILTCQPHAEEAEAWEFLDRNPAMIALMEAASDGETVLDYGEAYISGVPIGSAEYKAWRAMEARVN